MSVHPSWLLLAPVPLGAVLWWAVHALREVTAMQRSGEQLRADLERRFPWPREPPGPEP